MQGHEAHERHEQRGPRRLVGRPSRRGWSDLDRLHGRLRASLGEPISQGSLRLARRTGQALVLLDGLQAFDDPDALTYAGRRAVNAISAELSGAPGVFALIIGHTDPTHGEPDPDPAICDDAWQHARAVETEMIDSGVDPARLLSVGIVRCNNRAGSESSAPPRPSPSYMITICLTTLSREVTGPLRHGGRLD